jgi:Stress responsive A/B Barrel Domain
LIWGDDAKIFEDNFDLVAVMDFPDFAAARRYVEHPLHQRYVQEHAIPLIGERVVVQHEWQPLGANSVELTPKRLRALAGAPPPGVREQSHSPLD